MFSSYGKLSAEGQYDDCAHVLNLMLDLPSQALVKGGNVRELQQALERHQDVWRQYGDLAAPAASADSPDVSLCSASLSLTPEISADAKHCGAQQHS